MSEILRVIGQYRDRLGRAIFKLNEDEINRVVVELISARERGSTIFLAGNGGSSSTVNHFAVDWMLGTEVQDPPFRVFSLSESVASLSATGNDFSYEEVFSRSLKRLGLAGDLLVLVSASGNSPNLVSAAVAAKGIGIKIIALTGFDGGKLRALADLNIHTPTEQGDYGVAEDLHLTVGHIIKEALIREVRGA